MEVSMSERRNRTRRLRFRLGWLPQLLFWALLWGGGSAIAIVVGAAIAQVYPAPPPNMPLLERVRRGFRSEATFQLELEAERNSKRILTPEKREAAVAEIQKIQEDLAALKQQAIALERKLKQETKAETLEERLAGLTIALQTDSQTEASHQSPIERDFVLVFPSDRLFQEDKEVKLLQEGRPLLDTAVAEMLRIAPIQAIVTGYAAASDRPVESRERAFARAEAIAQHLQQNLQEEVRFLVVGSNAQEEARADRIEIRIRPRR